MFWHEKPGILHTILRPVSAIYSAVTQLRLKLTTPVKLACPVICVGNLVMGGAGKTPSTIALAKVLMASGLKPQILSRGYGADVKVPTLVNPAVHLSSDVGDEPLLLGRTAPTWVYKDRRLSGQLAIDAGANVLLMDDGFQNPGAYKDISFVVVDGKQGFGNSGIFPAGPLRESVKNGLNRADAVILIGKDEHNIAGLSTIPVIHARIQCVNPEPKRVVAFTGLGFPEKFYQTLRGLRYEIATTKDFADHHPYGNEEISELVLLAKSLDAKLVTTEKDLLRIPVEFHHHIDVLKIELIFDDTDALHTILRKITL